LCCMDDEELFEGNIIDDELEEEIEEEDEKY
jgi:hypothetical protein